MFGSAPRSLRPIVRANRRLESRWLYLSILWPCLNRPFLLFPLHFRPLLSPFLSFRQLFTSIFLQCTPPLVSRNIFIMGFFWFHTFWRFPPPPRNSFPWPFSPGFLPPSISRAIPASRPQSAATYRLTFLPFGYEEQPPGIFCALFHP